MIKQIGLPQDGHLIFFITCMITDRIALHSVLLLYINSVRPRATMLDMVDKIWTHVLRVRRLGIRISSEQREGRVLSPAPASYILHVASTKKEVFPLYQLN